MGEESHRCVSPTLVLEASAFEISGEKRQGRERNEGCASEEISLLKSVPDSLLINERTAHS